MKLKLQETDKLVKDTESKALLSVDAKGLQAYKLKRQQRREIEQMAYRLNKVEKQNEQILELLTKFTNKE